MIARCWALGAALLVMTGCSRGESRMTVAGSTTPTPVASIEPTPTPTQTGCPESTLQIENITPGQVTDARRGAEKAAASTVRLEAIPGPNRTNCLGINGIVIAHRGDEYVMVAAGHGVSGATAAWMIPWEGADRVPARILAYDTAPDMAVITSVCPECRKRLKDAAPMRVSPQPKTEVQLVGHTYGSIGTLAHPAQISDKEHTFSALGTTDAFVFTLVSGAAAAGDGVWTKSGELLGMTFYEEKDSTSSDVLLRDVFLTTPTLRGIARKVLQEPRSAAAPTTGPAVQVAPSPAASDDAQSGATPATASPSAQP